MTRYKDIALELQPIAPYLANIARTDTFRVPTTYFDQLTDSIITRCQETDELSRHAPTLFRLPIGNVFQIPTGYFDELYEDAIRQNTGQNPVTIEMPHTNRLAQQTAMQVPSAYFDQLHHQVIAKVRALNNHPQNKHTDEDEDNDTLDQLPQLAALRHQNPFGVPQNYFEQLHERVFTKTAQASDKDEENQHYPQLNQAAAGKNFKIPNNYFEQLHNNIIQQVQKKQRGQLIQMTPQPSKFQLFARYLTSAAAVITIFAAGYQFATFWQPKQTTNRYSASVVPMPELMEAISNLGNDEIKSFFANNPEEFNEMLDDPDILAGLNPQNLDANDFIEGFSNEDIKSFFDGNPEEFDEILDDPSVLGGLDFSNINLDDLNLDKLP